MITKIFGLIIFASSLWILYHFEHSIGPSQLQLFFWPAIVLTLIGPIGLLMLSADYGQLRLVITTLATESMDRSRRLMQDEADALRKIGQDYYVRGARAFETKDLALSEPLAKTLERLQIRIPIEDAIDLLERDRDRIANDLDQCCSIVTLGGRLAPSVGMLGTIIGMSQLLSHIKEPESIGASMSVALLTTFYGLFFSLALWTPLQHHFSRLLDLKLRSLEQALHWLSIINQRKPAEYLNNKENSKKGPAEALA